MKNLYIQNLKMQSNNSETTLNRYELSSDCLDISSNHIGMISKHHNTNSKIITIDSKCHNTNSKRFQTYNAGLAAERFVLLHMWFNNFRILDHRIKTPYGEIDIIFLSSEGKIIFGEIKYSENLKNAIHYIRDDQIIRINNAALYWLSINPEWEESECSFDAFFVSYKQGIHWIHNAWQINT